MSVVIDIRPLDPKDTEFTEQIRSRVQSLTFDDTDDGVDVLKLVLENTDRALSNSKKVIAGKGIIISWGESGNMVPSREITFTRVKSSGTSLIYEGKGKLFNSDLKPTYRRWDAVEVTELVRKVAREMGFNNPDISGLETEFVIKQQNTTNSRFLAKLAREFGVAFWIDNRNFHFKSRDITTPTRLRLVYRGVENGAGFGRIIGEPDIDFEYTRRKPSIVTNRTTPKVVAPGVRVEFKKAPDGTTVPVIIRTGAQTSEKQTVSGSSSKAAYAEKRNLPAKHEDRRYIAKAMFHKGSPQWQNKSRDKQTGTIPIHGDATLYPGDTIELYNYGEINEGKWYVRNIKHEVSRSQFTQKLGVSRTSGKKKIAGNVKGKTVKRGNGILKRWLNIGIDIGKEVIKDELKSRTLSKGQYGKSKTVYKKKRRQ